jgi:hypothetical protein
MLKISQIRLADKSVELKAEGRVVGPWVAELYQVCDDLLNEGWTLELDLTEVTFADPDGVVALTKLRLRGVSVGNCSPFMREQLRQPTQG